MKLAVVSESPADEAAIKILVEAVIGSETELVSTRLRPGGWPHVLQLLPSIVKALHYYSDADGLAVVVDSDNSPIHIEASDRHLSCNPNCRLCDLRIRLGRTITGLANVPNRTNMQTAIGIAVPAIEAWYQCGVDNHVNENTWGRGLGGERLTYDRRSLKVAVYGSDQPSLESATAAAQTSAQRLGANLVMLERLFPVGFGCLLLDLRQWQL